jgi:hypothetical protein
MQKKFGPYDTTLLSLLVLAYLEENITGSHHVPVILRERSAYLSF